MSEKMACPRKDPFWSAYSKAYQEGYRPGQMKGLMPRYLIRAMQDFLELSDEDFNWVWLQWNADAGERRLVALLEDRFVKVMESGLVVPVFIEENG